MTRVTEATYSNGVLKPVEDLGLREEQFFSQGPLPTREELHDRS